MKEAKSKPLVVIVGPTASGKTALAIELAKKYNGEIICADSRTIYRQMNIGTAKPTQDERNTVPHWGLDLINPGESFTVSDFKDYATKKIDEIRARNKTPFLVGGTGLYIDAVVFDYQFGPPPDNSLRQKMAAMSIEELHDYCKSNNIMLPANYKNKRYVIRAIEQKTINNKRRNSPIQNTVVVGITTQNDELKRRIQKRATQLFDSGVVEEALSLGREYGWTSQAMTANIYRLCRDFLNKEITHNELLEKFVTQDWRLAKRQRTWFARNNYIHWLSLEKAFKFLSSFLDSTYK